MDFPYDSTRNNQYTITDVTNQPGVMMDTFKVEVVRKPDPNRPGVHFDVQVSRHLKSRTKDNTLTTITSKQEYLDGPGHSIKLGGTGQLRQPLEITWSEDDSGSCTDMLKFRSGDGNWLRSLAWSMDRLGYGLQPSDQLDVNHEEVPVIKNGKPTGETQVKLKPRWIGSLRQAEGGQYRNPRYLQPGSYCTIDFLDDHLESNKVTCWFYAQGNT